MVKCPLNWFPPTDTGAYATIESHLFLVNCMLLCLVLRTKKCRIVAAVAQFRRTSTLDGVETFFFEIFLLIFFHHHIFILIEFWTFLDAVYVLLNCFCIQLTFSVQSAASRRFDGFFEIWCVFHRTNIHNLVFQCVS